MAKLTVELTLTKDQIRDLSGIDADAKWAHVKKNAAQVIETMVQKALEKKAKKRAAA